MIFRLRILFLAVTNFKGSSLRESVLITIITVLWIRILVIVSGEIPVAMLAAAITGTVLTLGGYLAGMAWPYWRVNWIVRIGITETLVATAWIGFSLPALQAAALVWQPLIMALAMYLYHERRSIYGPAPSNRLGAGNAFPEFQLVDSDGETQSLKSCLADGPVLFLFYRGDW